MDPFLHGDVPETLPQISAWLRGLEHLELNLERWTAELPPEGYWWSPARGVNPIAPLVRHIGGSSLRLLRYAQGTMPSDALREEGAHDFDQNGADGRGLYLQCQQRLAEVRQGIAGLRLEELDAVRLVGRKEIPVRTTIIVQHLLEHGHGHAGQVITMRKLYDAASGS